MRKEIAILFNLLFVLIFLIRCKEAEIAPKEYPVVLMKEVNTSASGAKFSADVVSIGNATILSYGFVWGDESHPEINIDDHKTLTSKLTTGEFAVEINSGLKLGQSYFVRPFIITEQFLVYGSELTFISNGSRPPEILDFQPKFGPVGTRVEITGINFGLSAKSNTVRLGQYIAKIDSASETKIYVKVPQVTEPGKIDLTVETAGMVVKANDRFDLYFPWFKQNQIHSVRENSTNFTIGDNAYIINSESQSGYIYNPILNDWSILNLPESSGLIPFATAVNNIGYLLLENEFWKYDPSDNSWEKQENYTGSTIYDRRYSFMFQSKNNVILGACGRDIDVWSFNTSTKSWTQLEDFPGGWGYWNPPWGNFTMSLNDLGYLGLNRSGATQFWEFNSSSGTWTQRAQLPIDSYQSWAFFAIEDKGYLALGNNSEWGKGYVSNQVWEYDAILNIWNRYQDCPVSMGVNASFGLAGRGYIFSGFTKFYNTYNETWEFDPSQN